MCVSLNSLWVPTGCLGRAGSDVSMNLVLSAGCFGSYHLVERWDEGEGAVPCLV